MKKTEDESFAAVLADVRAARDKLGCSHSGAIYRGHAMEGWPLVPSILRTTRAYRNENDLFELFSAHGYAHHNPIKSSWEILADMQHHGVPTRLLDWSHSFAVALYFAMRHAQKPCVWVMNGFRLNRRSVGKNVLVNLRLDSELDYVRDVVRSKTWPYDLPLVISPPWANQRIHAQQGLFSVHGRRAEPIERLSKSSVKCVSIPPQAWAGANRFLELAGVNEYSLFPDLDGLARHLKETRAP